MRIFLLVFALLLCSCNREIIANIPVKLDGSKQITVLQNGLLATQRFYGKEPYLNISKDKWNPNGYWGPYEIALCLIEDYHSAYAKYSKTRISASLETRDSVIISKSMYLVQPSLYKIDNTTCFYIGGGKLNFEFDLAQPMKLSFQVMELGAASEYVGDALLVISAGK